MRTLAILAGGLLAGVLAAAGPAAATEPAVWQGDLFIKTTTSACTPFGIAVDDFFRGIFRPLQSGVTVEALSFVSERSAFLLEAPTGDTLAKVSATSTDIGSRADFDRVAGGSSVVLKILPATITATTPSVEISGTITNFFNISGCTVGVSGVLGLRP